MITLFIDEKPLYDKESVDMVLTFRNLHNWLKAGLLMDVFNKSYAVLKPGGIFGVVEHRALPGTSIEDMNKSGYVTEKLAIEYAEKAGFVLIATSEINANPKDGTIHPKGVWTLPPSLRLGDEDKEITEEELKLAIRKGCLDNTFVPTLCGSAFKNKGVQRLLDAVNDFLPSPLDIGAISGFDPNDSDVEMQRSPNEDEPFSALAFKVMTDPYVGKLTFMSCLLYTSPSPRDRG